MRRTRAVAECRSVLFADLDSAGVARALSQIAEQEDDLVDAYFERVEEIVLPAEGGPPGIKVRREEGLAVRLVRRERSWLAARDGIRPDYFAEALRQVARTLPAAPYPEPKLELPPWESSIDARELAEVEPAVQRHLREHHSAFPLRLTVARHQRSIQVVGTKLVAEPQQELFYSLKAEMPWGRLGLLLTDLEPASLRQLGNQVLESFRCRQARPPGRLTTQVVLAPAAAAVLLHEAVAHALEADTLAQGGRPEAALGYRLAAAGLNVLDDPGSAPMTVRRTTDDEGIGVSRRWLLRDGIIEEPLADRRWALTHDAFSPGAGRRSHRHLPPMPRSSHLEVLPGDVSEQDLLGDDEGLLCPVAERGRLDGLSGEFSLDFPFARRLRRGQIGEAVGPCRLRGQVGELLSTIRGIGKESRVAGAGWCAKGGQKLPVWATTPALRLEAVEIES